MGGGTRTDEVSPEERLQALELLLRGLSDGRRERARRSVLEQLAAAFSDHGLPVPEWIRQGQERWAGDAGPGRTAGAGRRRASRESLADPGAGGGEKAGG